jgi:hypothetical protein
MPKQVASDSRSHFGTVLQSVTTPLGFLTLALLIVDVVITAFSVRSPQFVPYGVGLFLLIICLFFGLVWLRPQALYHPADLRHDIFSLRFPVDPTSVNLVEDKCRYEVCDSNGRKRAGTPQLVFGPGGWSFRVAMISPSETVSVTLYDTSGRTWTVRPFLPGHISLDVIPG